jgi:hypothetical protein
MQEFSEIAPTTIWSDLPMSARAWLVFGAESIATRALKNAWDLGRNLVVRPAGGRRVLSGSAWQEEVSASPHVWPRGKVPASTDPRPGLNTAALIRPLAATNRRAARSTLAV